MSPGLTLGLLALIGLGLLAWQVLRGRPRLTDAVGRLAPTLEPLGLVPDGGEESAEYCVQRYAGSVHGRPARLRILERPGRQRVLAWVDLEAPAELVEGLVARPEGLGEVRVRRVRGGFRLVVKTDNAQGWMADVELGLRAIAHEGWTSLHARRMEGHFLRLGFEGPEADLAPTVELAEGLIRALEEAAVAAWQQVAEARDMQLGEWVRGFRPVHGERGGCSLRAAPEEDRTVVRVRYPGRKLAGVRRVVHKDLSEGLPTGNAVLDMLVAVEGSAAIWDDEELVGAVLEVVHAWPGSELLPGQVVLRADRHLGHELGLAIDAALKLGERCAS